MALVPLIPRGWTYWRTADDGSKNCRTNQEVSNSTFCRKRLMSFCVQTSVPIRWQPSYPVRALYNAVVDASLWIVEAAKKLFVWPCGEASSNRSIVSALQRRHRGIFFLQSVRSDGRTKVVPYRAVLTVPLQNSEFWAYVATDACRASENTHACQKFQNSFGTEQTKARVITSAFGICESFRKLLYKRTLQYEPLSNR